MKTFIPYMYPSDSDENTNTIRGSLVSESVFGEIKDTEVHSTDFGKCSKDVIEFSVYSTRGEIFGWKLVEAFPDYINKTINYTNLDGEEISTSVSYLNSLYVKNKNGDVILSPKHELEELGITQGNYKIRISFRTDIVGSYENSTKLKIKEISPSRTEFKALPDSLKDSRNPNDVSFNFEYNNFIRKRVLVAHIINKLDKILKNNSFVKKDTIDSIKTKTSDYDEYLLKVEKSFGLDEIKMLRELDGLKTQLTTFYFNLILSQYNQTVVKEDIYSDYVKSVDFILENYNRFTQESNDEIKIFYKYMLIQMFDESVLDTIFEERFDRYLTNVLNFGNGISIPILIYDSYKDPTKSDNINDTLLIKTIEPLPDIIDINSEFYISSVSHSDDVIRNISLRDVDDVPTFKLRGPDITTRVTTETTKKYTLKGEDGLLKDDLSAAENFFNTTGQDIDDLHIDYSDFKKFVKFSAARHRLDNFILKLTKISKIQNKLNNLYYEIDKLNKEVSLGSLDEGVARDSILIMQREDIAKLNMNHADIIKSFTSYEKFLYYEEGANSWPRETSFTLSGFTGNLFVVNGTYNLFASKKFDTNKVFKNTKDGTWKIIFESSVGKWKLFKEGSSEYIYSTSSNLNSGFTANDDNNIGLENQSSNFQEVYLEDSYKKDSSFTPPQLIPNDINEFKKTEGYLWYESTAKKANLYDKNNDDSLANSIPEFLVRTYENEDFINFLNMIGEQFDVLLVYIEAMSNMQYIRNSFSKGVPNQLVWFVMNSFGINFYGREVDELSVSKKFEENRNTIWRRLLNNLPYILKTSGTESSIRALFKCYGVPDYLFQIKEFGGVNYGSDNFDSDTKYKLDTFNYALQINNTNQYLQIELPEEERDELSIEFRIKLDSKIFDSYEDGQRFGSKQSTTLPANSGNFVDLVGILTDDDFIIGSEYPKFFNKPANSESFRPDDWDDNDISISWKNTREGVSFSYPKVGAGTEPMFMTIYSNKGKLEDGTYDPLYTLAEIGATETLNGEIVRLSFSKDKTHQYEKEFNIDFEFNGTTTGTHYTIQELKDSGVFIKNNGHFPIMTTSEWEFGIYRDTNTFLKNYGKFYFTFNNTDGTLYCPDTYDEPIYFGDTHEYDILIKRHTGELSFDFGIDLLVKRVVDSNVRYSGTSTNLLSEHSLNLFLNTKEIFFGNYRSESFLGLLDRIRIYKTDISEKRFTNHINFNESYDIDDPSKLKENLLVKVNFDFPYNLNQLSSEVSYGVIKNFSLNKQSDIKAYNFTTDTYPYSFIGTSRRESASIPGYGSKSFSNEKIRIEKQTLISTLNPLSRSTKKSKDRASIDTNTLGVYFSPTDLVNREIIRFFGNFRLSNFIGDPHDIYSNKYKKLDSFKRLFFDNGFGNIDTQRYFNIIKSYIDPSIFENLEKVIPARVKLVSGLLIEPSILERSKIKPPEIKTSAYVQEQKKQIDSETITEQISFSFDLGPKRNNISSFANERNYIKQTHTSDVSNIETSVVVNKNKNEESFHFNYGENLIGEQLTDDYRDTFVNNGCVILGNNLYKVEKFYHQLEKASRYTGKYLNYNILLKNKIEISELDGELKQANGTYQLKFKGQSGFPVFSDDERIWWIFYSQIKGRWILASDGEINGGKKLATGQLKDFKNYIWLSGNELNYERGLSYPVWFSSGFNFSLPLGNIPRTGQDYFTNVKSVSSFDKFIEISGYINGWVNCNIYGVYSGYYVERIVGKEGEATDISNKKGTHTFNGEKRYLYLNGEFNGKLQSGWVGNSKFNEGVENNKSLKIVGRVNGDQYESCESPLLLSGDINDQPKINDNDKYVIDYKNYGHHINFDKKQFKKLNLVKVPSKLEMSDTLDLKFYSQFHIKNLNTSGIQNYASGKFKDTIVYKTINNFYSPKLWSVNLKYKVQIKSSIPCEVDVLYSNINGIGSSGLYKINDLLVKINKQTEMSVDVLNRGGDFKSGLVYNESGDLIETNLSAYINRLSDNPNIERNQSSYKKYITNTENNIDQCIIDILDKRGKHQFVLLLKLSLYTEMKSQLNTHDYLYNTQQYKSSVNCYFEDTPMNVNGVSHYILKMLVDFKGVGYTGSEFAYLTGLKPKNWKDTWPHKIKISDLFILDERNGSILKPDYSHYLFTGINWKHDKTITFNENPTIVLDSPDVHNNKYTKRKRARVSVISGLPNPKLEQSVKIKSLGNLKLGDTIGMPLTTIDDNTFFKTKSNIIYNVNQIYKQKLLVKSRMDKTTHIEKTTDIIYINNDSIDEFDVLPVITNLDTDRTDLCGDSIPLNSDTYDIQILNFENEKITYKENGVAVNKFFGIFNKEKYELLKNKINDEVEVAKLVGNYENRISSGCIKIEGFYGTVVSANGKYTLQYDVSYCGEEKISIPTYINDNKKWILLYESSKSIWVLKNINDKKIFISSETRNIKNGFVANANNNNGFYEGNEVFIKSNYTVDSGGLVYNEQGENVGKRFQSAKVDVHNKFIIRPNAKYIKEVSSRINTFLAWKIRIKSKKDSSKIYEIPIVYVNTDKYDDALLLKYQYVETELKKLKIIQTTDTDYCNIQDTSVMKWILTSRSENNLISEDVKIRTYGETLLVANPLKQHNKLKELGGEYKLIYGKIINKNNCKLLYSNSHKKYIIQNRETDVTLIKSDLYPLVGTYKTNTKNIYGSVEYSTFREKELQITVSGFYDDYENVNGIYRQVGYHESGDCLFKNDKGWLFSKNKNNAEVYGEWQITDSIKYPTKTISLTESIEQTGVYSNSSYTDILYVNFKLHFNFNNTRDFIGVDISRLRLTGASGKFSLFSQTGFAKVPSEYTDIDINFKTSSMIKQVDHYNTIPVTFNKTIADLNYYDDLQIGQNLKIENKDGLDRVVMETNATKTKYTSSGIKRYTESLVNLENKTHTIKNIYSNEWKLGTNYKVDETICYNKKMYRCKKDTPTTRIVFPDRDFDRETYWEVLNHNHVRVNVDCEIEVHDSKEYEVVTSENIFETNIDYDFSKTFSSPSEIENGVYESYYISNKRIYSYQKKYQPYDLPKVGTKNNVLIHGTLNTHTYKTIPRKTKRITINSNQTTISSSGNLDKKPPIVRSLSERDNSDVEFKDSFWFNQDEQTYDSELSNIPLKAPDGNPIIGLSFENTINIKKIILNVEGFVSDSVTTANGTYEPTNRTFNNYNVFKNNGDWTLYNNGNFWKLSNSKNIPDEVLDEDGEEWTTSDTSMLGSKLNGNNGSSSGFLSETAYIHVQYEEEEPTPTPTPTPTTTITKLQDTPTPTPTPTSDESPATPLPIYKTPTPTPIGESTPTPVPQPTPTPTKTNVGVNNDSGVVFLLDEFAITKEKYDLSNDPVETEKQIISDMEVFGYDVLEIATIEDLNNSKFIIPSIPDEIKSFNVSVQNYSMLETETYKLDDLNSFGWDSSDVIINGRFRPFYLTKNRGGRVHLYNGKNIFISNDFYLKSWPSKRCVLVKLKTFVSRVTDITISTGLPNGILISWKSSPDAEYVRIETSIENGNWQILEDNVSQVYSVYGFLDTKSQAGKLIKYRITSVGLHEKTATSEEILGWRLDLPKVVENLEATNGTFTDKIHIMWNKPTSENMFNKTESYSILRSDINDFTSYSTYDVIVTGLKEVEYTDDDSTLESGKTYWYKVVSHNDVTDNLNSDEYLDKRIWSRSTVGFTKNKQYDSPIK
jgi:hypothetical protein